MKTLHPVDEATYAKIGKAYLICSQHPDVFGNVTMEKFCGMFVDVIPEGEDERDARMKAYAPEMYEMLRKILGWCRECNLHGGLESDIMEVLKPIDGEDESADE